MTGIIRKQPFDWQSGDPPYHTPVLVKWNNEYYAGRFFLPGWSNARLSFTTNGVSGYEYDEDFDPHHCPDYVWISLEGR
jgi:hypothetical protein